MQIAYLIWFSNTGGLRTASFNGWGLSRPAIEIKFSVTTFTTAARFHNELPSRALDASDHLNLTWGLRWSLRCCFQQSNAETHTAYKGLSIDRQGDNDSAGTKFVVNLSCHTHFASLEVTRLRPLISKCVSNSRNPSRVVPTLTSGSEVH